MTTRTRSGRGGILVGLMLVCGCTAPTGLPRHTYNFDMTEPVAWSDVALDWGRGGFLDWTLADGGRDGKWIDDPDSEATKPGCKAFADWMMVTCEE